MEIFTLPLFVTVLLCLFLFVIIIIIIIIIYYQKWRIKIFRYTGMLCYLAMDDERLSRFVGSKTTLLAVCCFALRSPTKPDHVTAVHPVDIVTSSARSLDCVTCSWCSWFVSWLQRWELARMPRRAWQAASDRTSGQLIWLRARAVLSRLIKRRQRLFHVFVCDRLNCLALSFFYRQIFIVHIHISVSAEWFQNLGSIVDILMLTSKVILC